MHLDVPDEEEFFYEFPVVGPLLSRPCPRFVETREMDTITNFPPLPTDPWLL